MSAIASADLQARMISAKEQLDAHTREIVQWHFNPETGTPFWLEFAKKLDWDPRKEINRYEDLDKFEFFQDEWLRGGPVRRWVPKGLASKPIYVFETGGSTGVPKSRIVADDFRIDYEMFSATLPDEYFPKGSDWLMLGPSGPRRLRLAVEYLAQFRGGISFCVDLDPRWVIKLIAKGWTEHLQAYKDRSEEHTSELQSLRHLVCRLLLEKKKKKKKYRKQVKKKKKIKLTNRISTLTKTNDILKSIIMTTNIST